MEKKGKKELVKICKSIKPGNKDLNSIFKMIEKVINKFIIGKGCS